MTERIKVIVVCCNDFPVGVAASPEAAEEIIQKDRVKWDKHELQSRLHYHTHEFILRREP